MTNDRIGRQVLRAGVARAVITPPVGIRMCGYTVQECFSEGVERELTATALVLAAGDTRAVLVACDIVFIQAPHAGRIRERIGRALGIPPANVLLNASHTHLGPVLPGWTDEDEEQSRLQARYVAFLEEALVGVAAAAARNTVPARLGWGKGAARLGVNRREKMPDGRVMIGEDPAGAVDREVTVLRVDDLGGRPLATVMCAACHTVVLGPKTPLLSPDFVGPARQIVEAATGAPALFLQGAAGNVNPICGIGTGGPEQFDDLERLGRVLAGEVLKLHAAVRTHNRRGPRRVVRSVAAISVWDYEPTPDESVEALRVTGRTVTLPLAPLPDRAAAERQLAERRTDLDAARHAGAPRGVLNVKKRLADWAAVVLRHVEAGANPPTRDLELWALRLNDVGLVAVNGEPFAELALEVKRRSPLPCTIFLGYSNGCLGYLPTPEAFAEGGMEVEDSVRNYLLPAQLTPQWGPAVVENALDLLRQLSAI
jgi:hypothetical protein